jgi:nucleoid DNA-binding protein
MKKINKRVLWKLVNKKLNNSVHNAHTLSIINLFFDKLIEELDRKKSFKLINFGKFDIVKTKRKKFFDISRNSISYTKGNNKIRFILDKKIKKIVKKGLE